MTVIFDKVDLPSWYKIEKETGKTIQKLTDIKELVFYLENPDPFIRRLAILRVGQLKRRDSYTLLHGILDSNLETEENRELAALMMQKLNHQLNLGSFISHPSLSHFSGEEDLDDLLKITVVDTLPDIHFNFENALIDSQLHLDNEFLKSNFDEKDAAFPFSSKTWVRHLSSGLAFDIKKGLKALIVILFTALFIKGPKKILSWVVSVLKQHKVRKETSKSVSVVHAAERPLREHKTRSVTYSRGRAKTYRPPLSSRLKSLLRNFFGILFLPFRAVFHFKLVILLTVVALYGLFSFTLPGKSFLFRINPHAYYTNIEFIAQAKGTLLSFVQSNNTLATVFGNSQISSQIKEPEVKLTPKKELVVTASKGLYLRTEPNSNGNKLILMKTNTKVEFWGEEAHDQSGGLWFKVRLNEETTGWANALYFREG